MKSYVVSTNAEALALIEDGINPLAITSPTAPHGFKKDGTPASQRGRKPLPEAVKAAREAEKAAKVDGRKVRAPMGPLVRTEDAPFGVKKDGTPMAKRGRPTTEQALARKALIAAVMTSATTQAATVATPTETAAEALETALETVTVAEETVLEGPLTEAATADTSDDSFVHNNWHTNENVAALTTADDLSV